MYTMPHIIFNRKVADDYYKMRILCPAVAAKAKPGQFVMIRTADAWDPLLRRPLGIHRACFERETANKKESRSCIEILYRVVGKGTLMLSKKQRGETIDLLGPLGNGFSIDRNLKTAVLVAGGIGVAPLFSLAQALKERKAGRAISVNVQILIRYEAWVAVHRQTGRGASLSQEVNLQKSQGADQ